MGFIGNIIALPYMLAFYAIWILHSLARPLLMLCCLCALAQPTAAYRKLQLWIMSIQYLIFCNDKTWQASADPEPYFSEENRTKGSVEIKTIIFVRHGESTWNDTFNKGDRKPLAFVLGFVPGLVKAVYIEFYFWATGQANESWFFDAPLSSPKGLSHAFGVRKYLQQSFEFLPPREAEMMTILLGNIDNNNGKAKRSQLVTSNLRRAISTLVIGFQDRLQRNNKDRVMVLPCLQEISRNPDALSITPPHGVVLPSYTDPKGLESIYLSQMDTTRHDGNKDVKGNGLLRLQAFCRFVFDDANVKDVDAVIAAGHSLWFRSFFRTYLPHATDHVAKKKKLVNGGIAGFELQRIQDESGTSHYRIDPRSIVVLHGGF